MEGSNPRVLYRGHVHRTDDHGETNVSVTALSEGTTILGVETNVGRVTVSVHLTAPEIEKLLVELAKCLAARSAG